ncbi:efflux RND transporter permease subunit [Waddlia chondrophila]|uniref:Multidrug-efflux transport protein n=1 Tax=Waddlia chondrophila (strain ATCC VR-1470 / WSU 86-1044) TaxID=716544 RepID=D6YSX1_WADCW|nr:multidrug efflux RND transporter permease subunit [Waddlia chondrophila]ADI39166.1 multidrug-efflux transport protein [Waddlia chondrophila WSU 86-1044]
MFSHFFIDRPILSSVISIVIVLAGFMAMVNLPIAQYPEITPRQVQVTTAYPGASAEVVSNNVAAPIEQQVNGADDMLYMYSSCSSTGNMTLNVFFDLSRDPDLAQVDVQNRVNLALPQLPEIVTRQGVSVKKVSTSFMMIIAVFSPDGRYDNTYVGNYANLYILDAIKRIPGANQASVIGVPDYAMRLWVKPDRMAQLGITSQDIIRAVQAQNEQFAAGRVGQPPNMDEVVMTFPVTTQGRLTTPQEFEEIILRAGSEGAAIVKLKDIGRAELGSKDYNVTTHLNKMPATLIAVYQQPGSNALEVSEAVTSLLKEMKKDFPDGIDYKISMDTTQFVRASIHEVVRTFFEAAVLVTLVVLIFLGTIRATLIPLVAVPISILGAFIGMILMGFSINMLTLFGLILAIGVVVDDAIVVMENVERNMAAFKLSPREAARRAMVEVTGPVIATTLVVLAVFIPVGFMGGVTGELYKQFAITIAISVGFSSIVALTLSPALTVILLTPDMKKKGFFQWFDRKFDWINEKYASLVEFFLNNKLISAGVFIVAIISSWWMFATISTSFVPEEDQGYLLSVYMLPDASSLDRTAEVGRQVEKIFLDQPGVSDVATGNGYSLLDGQLKTNTGVAFVALDDYEKRKSPDLQAEHIMRATGAKMMQIREGVAFPINPPPIPGLGSVGGFEFWVQSQGTGTYQQLGEVINKVVEKAGERPELGNLTATINTDSQQLFVNLDRERAEVYGVPVQEVYDTLQTLFGSIYVSQFSKFSRLWQVIVQAESSYRTVPEDINQVYVRNKNNDMVPLSSLVSMEYVAGPDIVTRFNNFPAAKINGNPAPGYSSGQALNAMEEVAREVFPPGYGFAWSGQAFEEKKSGGTSAVAFIFGMVMVFLILAAQYERWSMPFAVILALPFALFGALLAIWLRGISNDVYFQIGMVALIALAAKNAILIVEFAMQKYEEGFSAYESALIAAKLRLRPICMTAFSFILGCVPLAMATGASANSRHSIGTGVIGGMLGATVIAIFFIPLFYLLLQKISGDHKEKSDEE